MRTVGCQHSGRQGPPAVTRPRPLRKARSLLKGWRGCSWRRDPPSPAWGQTTLPPRARSSHPAWLSPAPAPTDRIRLRSTERRPPSALPAATPEAAEATPNSRHERQPTALFLKFYLYTHSSPQWRSDAWIRFRWSFYWAFKLIFLVKKFLEAQTQTRLPASSCHQDFGRLGPTAWHRTSPLGSAADRSQRLPPAEIRLPGTRPGLRQIYPCSLVACINLHFLLKYVSVANTNP